MRYVNRSIVAALVASAGLASAASGASQNFPLGNISVGDFDFSYDSGLGTLGFNPTRAQLTTDWSEDFGFPYSSEALWAVANGDLLSATEFYFDPGPAGDSYDDNLPASISWDVYRAGYDVFPDLSAQSLTFIAAQSYSGSAAFWDNTSLTLSDDLAPTPVSYIDLGVVASAGVSFTIDTFGSDFDTELGFFNSAGGLADLNDDAVGLLSELVVPGLPAGDYYFNAGGFNTLYGAGGYQADVDLFFGSDGGNLNINIDGASEYAGVLDPDSNTFFKITVVPAPSALAVVGLAGLAGLRRRR